LGGAADEGASLADWELDPRDDEPPIEEPLSGRTNSEGFADLTQAAVEQWRRWRLVVSAPACLPVTLATPPTPLPGVIQVTLLPNAKEVSRFRGRVVDGEGRGIGGAGVFLEDWSEWPGVLTDADGAFDLSARGGDLMYDEHVDLVAVAPGHLAGRIHCLARGQEGLSIPLEQDTQHARVEVVFEGADGAPAPGTRAWFVPSGEPFPSAYVGAKNPAPLEPGAATDTRRYLPRVVGGQSIDDQGHDVGKSASLLDLVADEEGRLLLPAVQPGKYAVRGVLAEATRRGRHAPEVGTLHIRATVEAVMEVAPPPTVTRVRLRLVAGRAVTGRIEVQVNAAWHCAHAHHEHWLEVNGWDWSGVSVESGEFTWAGRRTQFSGRFRLDGVPRTACTLRLWTTQHPEVWIELPERPPAWIGPEDVGILSVPDAKVVHVLLRGPDGSDREPTDPLPELRIEGYSGVRGPHYGSSEGAFSFVAPSPPPASTAISVHDKKTGRLLVRVPVPGETSYEAPFLIRVPKRPEDEPPAREPGDDTDR
jgi:hypothetical protein